MGLAEKRVAAAMQKDQAAEWCKKVNAAAGVELAFEIQWSELVKEGFLEHYPQTVDYNFFAPLVKSLGSICADDLGKEAFRAKFKKVKIGSTRSWCSLEVTIDGDTLGLDADPSYSRDESTIADYAERMTTALEKAL